MYLYDDVVRKMAMIEAQVKHDSGKLFGHEWRDWRVYNFILAWITGVPALSGRKEKDQLSYLFCMEFVFFNLLEGWKEYFGYNFDSVLVKDYMMKVIDLLEPLRSQLGIAITGHPLFEGEYSCPTCKQFYYHKSAFEVHCIKCETMLDFLGIIPVEKLFTGFSTNRIPRYFGDVLKSVAALDL